MPDEPVASRPQTPGSKGLSGKLRFFGDYELFGEIGQGRLGVVYRACQLSLNRRVALKIVRPGQLASAAAVECFRSATEAAARLDHPHIVPIYQTGEHDGLHYLSRKLINGRNLLQYIARRSNPDNTMTEAPRNGRRASLAPIAHHLGERPKRAELRAPRPGAGEVREGVALLAKVAQVVEYAHQRGVLHRALQPANILLDENNQPHLTDFALAKIMENDISPTSGLGVTGPLKYLAPEQVTGSAGQLSPATDIYSLGAILYELLTNSPPFRGKTLEEIARKVLDQAPERPDTLNPLLSRDLAAISLKCLEKAPQKRYSSATMFASDLERWLAGKPILV